VIHRGQGTVLVRGCAWRSSDGSAPKTAASCRGEVRVAADEPEAVDLDPGVLARRLDAPATVKAGLEQGGRVLAL